MIEITFPTDDITMALEWYLEKNNVYFDVTNRGFYDDGWSFINKDDFTWVFFEKNTKTYKAILQTWLDLTKTYVNELKEELKKL